MKRIKSWNSHIMARTLTIGESTRVHMPRRAQILGVRIDVGGALWLSAAVFKEAEQWEIREFIALTEIMRIPHERGALSYVGLVQSDMAGVTHVFEVNSPEDRSKVGSTRGAAVVNENSGSVAGLLFQAGSLGAPGAGVSTLRRPDRGVYVQ